MPVITLTTEWRPDDIYTGILKGRICSLAPGANIIDNASALPAFNIPHASFVVRNTFSLLSPRVRYISSVWDQKPPKRPNISL